ncbi:MAG: energy-coupling factor transporter transmembrane protein EcfT [Chloroflexi bacterium]|nr:energy-coupling factor transporter transmembrane protein EcfT [Chloroflexota bacterium]
MHLRSWLAWIGSIVIATLSMRNPLYMVLMLLIVQVVSGRTAEVNGVKAPTWWLRFGALVVPLSALYNGISVHFGDTPLFVIPGGIPLLSGPVTLEALVYGALNGLVITVVVSVFSVLNLAAPAYQLVRSTPRAFQSMGVTVGIALTFIPQTVRRFKEVREAQSVRGHRVRRLRDWLPLWLPLLIGGLEQSTQLSEAMVARGFGATQDRSTSMRTRLLFAIGLAVVLAGWVISFLVRDASIPAALLMLGGALAIVAGLWLSGRAVPHTDFRPQQFTRMDMICLAGSIAIAVLLLAPLPFLSQSTLQYYPYPKITLPSFDPVIGLLMLVWLSPMLAIRTLDHAT